MTEVFDPTMDEADSLPSSWSTTQRLHNCLKEMESEKDRIKAMETRNKDRIRYFQSIRSCSNLIASIGYSSSMGLALATASLALAAPIALPATIAVVVGTFVCTAASYSCHRAVKALQERAKRIYCMASLVRTTERYIYERYLDDDDEVVTIEVLTNVMRIMEEYHEKMYKMSLNKPI